MKVFRHSEKPVLIVQDPTEAVASIAVKSTKGMALMPHTLEAERLLINAGVQDVPSVVDEYEWPGMFSPYAHQIEMVKFRMHHRRIWDLSGMRTGKTAAAVWGAHLLMRYGAVKRVLVLSPLSVVRDAWGNAMFDILPQLRTQEATGPNDKARRGFKGAPQFVLANHDKVKYLFHEIVAFAPDLIVLDEAVVFKNYKSDRYRALKAVVARCKCRVWALSATPAAQRPTDPWAIGRIINPDTVPWKFTTFRDNTMVKVKVEENIWVKKAGWEEHVLKALQPSIRFRTQDVIDMPIIAEVMRFTPMGTKQARHYNQMKKSNVITLEGENITARNAAAALVKLRQISSGLIYNRKAMTVEVDASSKYSELRSIIDETRGNGKFIVFTPFTHVMQWLTARLKKDGVVVEALTSNSTLDQRTKAFTMFQKTDQLDGLIMHPDIAKYGLTLTAANTTIWWGPIYAVDTFIQANMRMIGPGSHGCTVVMMHSTDDELKIYQRISEQEDVSTAVIDEYRRIAG